MNLSKIIFIVSTGLFVSLQYYIWLEEDGYRSVSAEKKELLDQTNINQGLSIRNEILKAEITDLREGDEAIEEIARSQLGMIASDEMFFILIER
jgi:cell division protein FtsB